LTFTITAEAIFMGNPERKDGNPKRQEILENVLKQIQKTYGEGAIMRLGEKPVAEVEVIPTGSLALDIALGVGGVPRGRIVEIFGPEASGKTTLALHIVAEAQRLGGTAAFIDAEHALDPKYCQAIGVKLDELLLSQPSSGEQALEIMEALVRSGAVDVIVVDSVAALVPEAELQGQMGEAQVGLQARLMSQAMRKLAAAIAQSKTVAVFVNQIRAANGFEGFHDHGEGHSHLLGSQSCRSWKANLAVNHGQAPEFCALKKGGQTRGKFGKLERQNLVAAPDRQTPAALS